MADAESIAITQDDLLALRDELEGSLLTTAERIEAIELRFGAIARVVSTASRSVIFLQGAYGFEHVETGQLLRRSNDTRSADGASLPPGRRPVTLDGEGPPVEIHFTGTGFIGTEDGLIVTNRHVAQPWEGTELAPIAEAMGLRPVIRRLIGYLPGEERAFDVDVVRTSDDADIAVLRCGPVIGRIPALTAGDGAPSPGDEVIVLGYPAGIAAMLARSDRTLLAELSSEGDMDFWRIGERLANAGHTKPFATRGIVGQERGGLRRRDDAWRKRWTGPQSRGARCCRQLCGPAGFWRLQPGRADRARDRIA